ncbi:MAG: GDP-4-dehydro-6-deoxy-D-mannose reductase [Thermoleophilaceae bacterium]|nr:GDP-4-dehydro-6-deoxy-D-mannose reductase [Thermoleophilaceae bacterium]
MLSGPIVVTGASGFVGSHVSERARSRGLDVHGTTGDLREAGVADRAIAAARPAAVVHLAAPPRTGGGSRLELLADELRMAAGVIDAVARHAPEAPVLIPGSAGQYGMGEPDPLRETSPTRPVSAYGTVKCALELACVSEPLRAGVRVIWARSFNHVGPGQGLDAPIPAWARQVAAAERAGGGVLRTGKLDVVRDFLDVRDVADAYLDLVASGAAGVVNVGSGDGVTLTEVVEHLVGAADVEVALERDPALERSVDPPVVVADIARLRELTGFERRIPLAESLRDVLAEWRARAAAEAVR